MLKRFLPRGSAHDAPFWSGLREGRLMLQRDITTGRFQAYPRAHSLHTEGGALEWVAASGGGEVITYSVVHRSMFDDLPAPYVFAIVRLDEGVQMTGHVVGCPPQDVCIGMRVTVTIQNLPDGTSLPAWQAVR